MGNAEGGLQAALRTHLSHIDLNAMPGITAPLPVGVVPRAPAAATEGQRTQEITLVVEKIEISVPSGDPQRIAAEIVPAIEREKRKVVEAADSRFLV